ncbi:hypothetical protein [Aurantimonas sp. 22II-16-19i]|uniref:hypothetical protein n=1 Tax=Aurantimonas sp. 22II-16-19i TaxID=1317114 RepID=UPI00111C42B0|nr:hypothetical protein [Aurantimonas sp. 22II-16-19i]
MPTRLRRHLPNIRFEQDALGYWTWINPDLVRLRSRPRSREAFSSLTDSGRDAMRAAKAARMRARMASRSETANA